MGSIVQQASGSNASPPNLAIAPTSGNILVLLIGIRQDTPSGVYHTNDTIDATWTQDQLVVGIGSSSNSIGLYTKIATTSEKSWKTNPGSGAAIRLYLFEVSAVGWSNRVTDSHDETAWGTINPGSFSPTTTNDVLLLGISQQDHGGGQPIPDLSADWTNDYLEDKDGNPGWGGNFPSYSINHAQGTGLSVSEAFDVPSNGYDPADFGVVAIQLTANPLPGVWFDWNRDGFNEAGSTIGEEGLLARIFPEGGSSGFSDNITTECRRFDWTRGGTADLVGGAGVDSATVVVKNTAGKYNPDNTSSVFYGLLKPGVPMWIGANADGTLAGSGQTIYGIFAGRLREIAPIPAGGASDAPEVELICDGILTDWGRKAVHVADSTTRSQDDFREAVLTAIGEAPTYYSLAVEADTLPISSADSADALSVLESLNSADGTRHTVFPESSLYDWYTYTSYNRHYHLGSTSSASLNAGSEHVTDIGGLRFNADTVINDQRATVDPATISPALSTVWTYDSAPFHLTGNKVIWAEFADYVDRPEISINLSSGSVTSTLTSFGHSAKIELYSAGAQVSTLAVIGHALTRSEAVTVTTDFLPESAPSQATYGVRTGSPLSGDLLGSEASAQGMVDHIVYRYHEPLRRPSVTVMNWIPGFLTTKLYDVIDLTVAQFDMTARLFDVVGIAGSCDFNMDASRQLWQITYQLQESSLQTALQWFTLNTSVLDGPDQLGY